MVDGLIISISKIIRRAVTKRIVLRIVFFWKSSLDNVRREIFLNGFRANNYRNNKAYKNYCSGEYNAKAYEC